MKAQILAVAVALPRLAAAEEPRVPSSVRGFGALGWSDLGPAGYLGVEGEAWITRNFALGGRAAVGEETTVLGGSGCPAPRPENFHPQIEA